MLIVSVDTSGRRGSIALCRGNGDSFEVLQLTSLEGGTYSAQLLPRIAEALQQNSLNKTEVDGFVVVSGPGSFTGLRVGLSTVKGLCEVLRKPLATVSMLEAIVLAHGRADESVIAALGEAVVERDPQAEIRLKLVCPSCDNHWFAVFDILAFLWQEITTHARRILRDVHVLASAYGWSESEILALSAMRRRFYLEMVAE